MLHALDQIVELVAHVLLPLISQHGLSFCLMFLSDDKAFHQVHEASTFVPIPTRRHRMNDRVCGSLGP
jgi:hypothetical protein